MTPEKHYKEMLDVVGTSIALTNELNTILENPIRDGETRNRVHALMASLSGHLLIVEEYEAYTGGGVVEAMHATHDRAIGALSETSFALAA